MTHGGSRPGAGRPRKPADELRRPLPTKHPPAKIDAYREAAARVGLRLTDWIELHLDRAATR